MSTSKLVVWSYVIIAVAVAVSANYISSIWASKEDKFTSPWFLALILISPFVFITFGLVTAKLGLAVTSGTVDALLTISTVVVGLFLLREWNALSLYQYIGLTLSVGGIILMQFHK